MKISEIKKGIIELIKNGDVELNDYVRVNRNNTLTVKPYPSIAAKLNVRISRDLDDCLRDPNKITEIIETVIEAKDQHEIRREIERSSPHLAL